MTGLVQACVDSAVQTVQTLSQLKDFELIGIRPSLPIDR